MRVALTGSIATDHLMSFPGRFAEQLLADALHKVSLSFLVDDLDIRRGGVAANIAFGMGQLGGRPVLVGAVGDDFADYRAWLEGHGVDTAAVLVSATKHTARFLCTTDLDNNQIASFYPGAMSESAAIDLAPIAADGLDLVVVSPNDPAAMIRHTEQARELGIPFVADPSQQLARMDGEDVRRLVDGAAMLFTNDYEADLLASKTGWTAEDVLARVGSWIVTRGADGVSVRRQGEAALEVPVVADAKVVEPTGVGDAFRAGYLSALSWGLKPVRCAQVGNLLAAHALAAIGTQEYAVTPADFVARLAASYGASAASDVAPHLLP